MRTTAATITAGTWCADVAGTEATFMVRSFMLGRVSGSIDVVAGSVQVDASGSPVRIEAVLDPATFHTGNQKRDSDICSKRFLDVRRYPQMRYCSTSIATTDDGWFAAGELFVRDRAAPLDLTIKLVEGDDSVMSVEAEGAVDRAAAGIRVPSFLIGREVPVRIAARLLATGMLSDCHPVLGR